MNSSTLRYALYAAPILIVAALVALIETMPMELGRAAVEDGPIENLTAISFVVAAIALVIAARSPILRASGLWWTPAITLAWALLMLLCAGEEISWGQRIFGVTTPEWIAKNNMQEETNVHNLSAVNFFLGGPFRWMSIYLLLMGFGIPLAALTRRGRMIFGALRFPVSPWAYAVLFLGAYFFHQYYRNWFPVEGLQPPNTPTEIRELLLAVGSAFFAAHAALWPDEVYLRSNASA